MGPHCDVMVITPAIAANPSGYFHSVCYMPYEVTRMLNTLANSLRHSRAVTNVSEADHPSLLPPIVVKGKGLMQRDPNVIA